MFLNILKGQDCHEKSSQINIAFSPFPHLLLSVNNLLKKPLCFRFKICQQSFPREGRYVVIPCYLFLVPGMHSFVLNFCYTKPYEGHNSCIPYSILLLIFRIPKSSVSIWSLQTCIIGLILSGRFSPGERCFLYNFSYSEIGIGVPRKLKHPTFLTSHLKSDWFKELLQNNHFFIIEINSRINAILHYFLTLWGKCLPIPKEP